MTNIVHSTLWSIVQRYLPSLLHIIATLVITRLISPSDFGEVALVMTFIQIAQLLVQSGLSDGLIYNSKNTDKLYSTVFYVNIGIALAIYLILYFSGIYIATFYGIPRLEFLIKVVSLNLIFFSISITSRCILILSMKFKELAKISLIASIFGSVLGVCMAYRGFNVWAIVAISLSINIVETTLIVYHTKWIPKLQFSTTQLLLILPYSMKIFFNNIVQVLYDNIYSLSIGKVFNARTLGLFNRMQTVMYYTTTNFMYSVENVFFPFLVNKRDQSTNVNDFYERILRLSICILFPVVTIMFSLAKPIIIIILTDRWLAAVPILKYLSAAYFFIPLIYVNNSFLKLNNLAGVLFKSNLIKKILGVLVLFSCLPFGIHVVCYGLIFYFFCDCLISMFCIHKYVGIRIFSQIKYVRAVLFFNVIATVLLVLFESFCDNYWIAISVGIISYLFIYICYLKLLNTLEWRTIMIFINKI